MTRGVYPVVPKVRVPKVRARAVRGAVDARARRVDASSGRRARTTMATTMATVMCARARARGMPTVVVRARERTRRVTTATMRFSVAPSGGVASSTTTVRVMRAKASIEGMSARTTVARAFRGADPQTEEEEGSVLDFPEEYVRAVPSRRPDIFPDLKEPKTPMPHKMPGDPEMPDEEEEEKERKENPGEPGEKPEDEEEEEAEKKKKKKDDDEEEEDKKLPF